MRRRPVASRRLALEPLESRAMLSVTVEGLDAAGFVPDVAVCPCPVIINGPGDTVEPQIIIDPLVIDQPIPIDLPIIDGPIFDRPWNTDDSSEAVHSLLEEYNAFLADHPDWLSDHGADGIQLQVMTESAYVSGLFLSNPGTARAFDAWIEQTYLALDGETLLVYTDDSWLQSDDEGTGEPFIDDPCPVIDDPCPVIDEPFIDGPCPVVDDQDFVTGAADAEVRALAFSTIGSAPTEATASISTATDGQWMGQAVAFLPGQSAEAAAPARPKRGVAAPIVRG